MDTSSYLSLFLQEMRENCNRLNQALLRLEESPSDPKLLQECMRLGHSCKGIAATMGFSQTADLCHAIEDAFDAARADSSKVTPAFIDACLHAADIVGASLSSIEAGTGENVDASLASRIRGGTFDADTPVAPQDALSGGFSASDSQIVRVEADKLDALLDVAGELAVLRLQLATAVKALDGVRPLQGLIDRFGKLTDDLEFRVSQTRLIPLENAFFRFPRLVRDLARQQGKNVKFSMTGGSLALDKTPVDTLIAPLVHLLRNAVDHGIETPQRRRELGKPEESVISLDVQRSRGCALISVEDDGEPIDLHSLKTVAREHGFSQEELDAIGEENILDLLCSARFSSNTDVTMTSGRGVGLSAVRVAAQALGGTLTLERREHSKRFVLSLPLQLSLLQVILVRVAGNIYGLPMSSVERLLSIPSSDVRSALGRPMTVVDGEELPLLHLSELFGAVRVPSERVHLLLVRMDSAKIGLCVEEILSNEEIMVKPAPETVRKLEYFSGQTILGDGSVALILDVPRLLKPLAAQS